MSDDGETPNDDGWRALAEWSTGSRMNELEGLMWRGEHHPEFSSAGVVVEILDRNPDWTRFRAAFEWATTTIARLRQVVVEPALPTGPPAWRYDNSFDLDEHLHRDELPSPGGTAELMSFAQRIGTMPLDRSRPLWTCHLVSMAAGRAAIVLHTHHCLTDGAGMIELLNNMHSDRIEPSPNKPVVETIDEGDPPNPLSLSLDDFSNEFRAMPRRIRGFAAAAVRAAASPERTVEFLGSMRRVLSPAPGTHPSPLFEHRTGRDWRLGMLECDLTELKAAGRAVGGSLNDAYLAALLGGIRRYHEAIGVPVGDIRVAMPVSVRRPEDPSGGNRFAGAMIAGPAGEPDPAERIAAIRGSVLTVRAEPAIEMIGMISPLLNRIPNVLLEAAMRLAPSADLSASNVPGIPHPVYAAGAKVERMFVFAPLPNVAMMSTLVSYAGTCCIGINADGAVYADTDLLWASMRSGLDEVLTLGCGTATGISEDPGSGVSQPGPKRE